MTNEQTLGYVLLAAKSLKLSEKEMTKLVNQVEEEIDFWTEECAEQTYEEFKEV